jgi:hypothetical protein
LVIVGLTGAALAAPILALRYPPMGDLPFHESLVAILRHFHDESFVAPGLYVHNFGPPNQLFHLFAWALALAMPTDTACKIVIAAAVVSTPLGALRLARHFDRSEWSALLAAPLALGFAFRWGLVGNVVALPALLFVVPMLDRTAARGSRALAAASMLCMAVLYGAHESALVVGVLASTIFGAVHLTKRVQDRSVSKGVAGFLRLFTKEDLGRLAPIAFGLSLAAWYAVRSVSLKAPSILAVPDTRGPNVLARLAEAPRVLFGPLDAPVLAAAFSLYVAALACLGVARLGHSRDNAKVVASDSAVRIVWLEEYRLALLAGACGIAFLAVPLAYAGSTLLYQRFLPMGCAFFAVALAPWARAVVRPIVPLLGVASALAAVLVCLPWFGEADRRFRELDAMLPLIDKNSAVAALDLTPHPPGMVAPIPGAAARVLAERGGRLLFSFTDAPTAPVIMAKDRQWNEPVLRLTYDPLSFSPSHDLRLFRYVLVRLAPDAKRLAPLVIAAMAPEARLVADSGEWQLFESTLDVVPIASSGVSAASPGLTLAARFAALASNQGRR